MIYAIYLGGFMLVMIWTFIAASQEAAAHGQGVIFSLGCLIAMLWPLVLIWALLATGALCMRKARTGLWDWER